MGGVAGLQKYSNWKSLVQSYPVQSLFDVRQAADGRTVFLKESPSDTFDLSLEPLARVAQQRNLRGHVWSNPVKQVLPEIREHVPFAAIHQRQDGLPRVGVLSLRNVEIGDVAVERRSHEAVVVVKLSVFDRFLRRTQSLIHVAHDSQLVLCLLKLGTRAGNGSLGRFEFVTRLDQVVLRDGVKFVQGDDTIQVLPVVRRINLAIGQLRCG